MHSIGDYFRTLFDRFGKGWNRFWFAPRDPLTLGMIRILTAAMAIALYLTYLPDLTRLFGPDGLLSRDAMLDMRDRVPVFSTFDWARSTAALWIFYWAGAAALAAMLVGLFTRVTSVLALVAVLSLIYRGPMLARPVDDIVAMLMFYLCLGPCGRTLSIDAWIQRMRSTSSGTARSIVPSSAATISTRLIQVHLSAIYFAMAFAKLRGTIGTSIWWDGSAVWDLMARPEYPLVNLSGLGFSDPGWYFINIWTLAILAFEFSFAILIWNRLARPLLLGISLIMWVGTALLTGMVSFAVIMLVAGLAFIPPATLRGWRRSPLEPAVQARD
ncbi:MAG TPA: hypothetical protein VHX65_14815 [Pirellulales bacterium]|jgi:hypothetical protein|nr:hypothetical protein [Pirellulales bacterium]